MGLQTNSGGGRAEKPVHGEGMTVLMEPGKASLVRELF